MKKLRIFFPRKKEARIFLLASFVFLQACGGRYVDEFTEETYPEESASFIREPSQSLSANSGMGNRLTSVFKVGDNISYGVFSPSSSLTKTSAKIDANGNLLVRSNKVSIGGLEPESAAQNIMAQFRQEGGELFRALFCHFFTLNGKPCIRIDGSVKEPGLYPLRSNLQMALSSAGGIDNLILIKNVKIIRNGKTTEHSRTSNPALRAGDIVLVM